ncbi:hypothetical protein MTO96_016716 [Rhipicephalus appendiculatus]
MGLAAEDCFSRTAGAPGVSRTRGKVGAAARQLLRGQRVLLPSGYAAYFRPRLAPRRLRAPRCCIVSRPSFRRPSLGVWPHGEV